MSLTVRKWWPGLAAACWFAAGTAAMAQTPVVNCGLAVGNSAAAIPAAGGTFIGSTGSTRNPFDDGCGSLSNFGANVWYNWTPTVSGSATLSLCTTVPEFDAVLSVYTTCPTATVDNLLACGDDDCGSFGTLPRISLTIASGTTYLIRVANFSGVTPRAYTLVVSPPVPPAANDECADVFALTTTSGPYAFTGTGFSTTGSTAAATTSAGTSYATCGVTGGGTSTNPTAKNDLFYKFTPSVSTNYNISLCSSASAWDSILSIHTGCATTAANQLVCNDDGVCAGGVGLSAILNQPLDAGTPYAIRVATYTTGTPSPFSLVVSSDPFGACCTPTAACSQSTAASCTGTFTVGGACTATACVPANDDCATAIVISSAPYTSPAIGIGGALADQDVACNSTAATVTNNGVWFTFTPTVSGQIALAQPSGPDTVTAVFTGTCGSLTEIACSDPAAFIFSGSAGVQYFILVGVFSSTPTTDATPLVLTLSILTPIPNDTCATATVITTTPFSDSYEVRRASADIDVSCNDSAATGAVNSAWWTYTATANSIATFADDDNFDTVLAAFTGTCGSQTELICTDEPQTFSITLSAGTQYYFFCGRWSATPSSSDTPLFVFFDVAPIPAPPANDTCSSATLISSLPFTSGSIVNAGAADDQNATCNGTGVTKNGVWFTYTPTSNCNFVLSETTSQDAVFAVFIGDCSFPLEAYCTLNDTDNGTFSASAGTQYFILVGKQGTGSAAIGDNLNVTFNCLPVVTSPPANDLCSGATVISTLPFDSGSIQSFLATNDDDVTCNSTASTAGNQGVWFSWTATPACSALRLSETGDLDTATTVFTGTCGGTLTEVACSDPETFTFTGTAGTQYYILVSRWSATALGAFDAYRLTADCFVTPPNDECSNALPITVGQTVSGNLINATGVITGTCIGSENDVWYAFTASVGGTFTFTGTVPSGDTGFTALVAFSACGGTELACQNPGAGASTVLTVSLATGESMVLRVSRYADSTFNGAAPFSVAMTGPAQVSNVTCCRGTTCSLTLAASCTAPAGVGVSLPSGSTTCNATGTNVSPCCFADYDKNGSRTVDDIFIYINAWFGVASNPYCKIGGNGVDAANIDDIFIFLNVWFAGGCG